MSKTAEKGFCPAFSGIQARAGAAAVDQRSAVVLDSF
jgi:hypothetical protein